MTNLNDLDLSTAINYHYGQFPPQQLNYEKLAIPLSNAVAALARYDQMLKNMHNSEILLAPLRSQEAVISSRMEGTISTLDEVLRYEADQEDGSENKTNYRSEALEVFLYSYAMRKAQQAVTDGQPISPYLIRSMHKTLLGIGRGANLSPGEFKEEQNYLADRNKKKVLFIPIAPEQLMSGMDKLIEFSNDDEYQILSLIHI